MEISWELCWHSAVDPIPSQVRSRNVPLSCVFHIDRFLMDGRKANTGMYLIRLNKLPESSLLVQSFWQTTRPTLPLPLKANSGENLEHHGRETGNIIDDLRRKSHHLENSCFTMLTYFKKTIIALRNSSSSLTTHPKAQSSTEYTDPPRLFFRVGGWVV